ITPEKNDTPKAEHIGGIPLSKMERLKANDFLYINEVMPPGIKVQFELCFSNALPTAQRDPRMKKEAEKKVKTLIRLFDKCFDSTDYFDNYLKVNYENNKKSLTSKKKEDLEKIQNQIDIVQ